MSLIPSGPPGPQGPPGPPGPGSTNSLAITLGYGNTTGNNDIVISEGQKVDAQNAEIWTDTLKVNTIEPFDPLFPDVGIRGNIILPAEATIRYEGDANIQGIPSGNSTKIVGYDPLTGALNYQDNEAGTVTEVVAGRGITVDSAIPYAPVVSLDAVSGSGISIIGTDQVTIANTGLLSAVAGDGITVSAGQNPTISNTGILATTAGTGIDITGTQANKTISNTGLLTATAGDGINVSTGQNPVISNTGVLATTASTGISITGDQSNKIFANTGILTTTAGTGISVSVGQNPTISNTGILTTSAGTGISVTSGQNPVVSNTGLLSASAGDGITVSAGQNPTIANTGVLATTAGSGIEITGTQANKTISNTGVLATTAGSGIEITGTQANKTIANTGLLSATAGSGISITTGQNPTIANTGILQVQGTTGNVTASTVSGTATVDLASVGTAGTYNYPTQIVVDSKGRVTATTEGDAPITSLSAGLAIDVSGNEISLEQSVYDIIYNTLYSNSYYVNDNTTQTFSQAMTDIGSSQGNVIYVSAGSYSETWSILGKNNLSIICPSSANTKTICEVTSVIDNDGVNASQRLRFANLQINSTWNIRASGNNYYSGMNCPTGSSVVISGLGSHFFADCEFSGSLTILGFAGVVTFYRCNFENCSISLPGNALQVYFSDCLNLPYGFYNTLASAATFIGLNVSVPLGATPGQIIQSATFVKTANVAPINGVSSWSSTSCSNLGSTLETDGTNLYLKSQTGATLATVQGTIGPEGPAGPPGSSSSFYNYKIKTTQVGGDPGPSYITYNNADQLLATQISIDHLDENNNDLDVLLSLIVAGDVLIIQDRTDSNNYQKWLAQSASTVYPNQYITVDVTLDSTGYTPYTFTNNHQVLLIVAHIGQAPTPSLAEVLAEGAVADRAIDMNNNKITALATPTVDTDASTKKYVDDQITARAVELTGAQTIAGLKTFTTLPQSSATPSVSSDFATKGYVDSVDAGHNLEFTLQTGNSAGAYTINMNNNKITSVGAPTDGGDATNKTYVDNGLAGKQDTGTAVLLTGNQTVAGVKTFNSLPQSSATPSSSTDLTTKSYVDTGLAGKQNTGTAVLLTGDQTVAGLKTFTTLPQSSVVPAVNADLVNKEYVDGATIKGLNDVLLVNNQASTTIDMAGNQINFLGAPTSALDAVTKQYVDDGLAGKQDTGTAVLLTGDQTVAGIKTFSSVPVCATQPSLANELANKAYVDSVAGGGGGTVGTLQEVLTEGNSVGTASGINMNSKPLSNVVNITSDAGNAINLITNSTEKLVIGSTEIDANIDINMNNKKLISVDSVTLPTSGYLALGTDGNPEVYVVNNTGSGLRGLICNSKIQMNGNQITSVSDIKGTNDINLYIGDASSPELTIDNIKATFKNLPECSDVPTTANQLTNKAYVDSVAGGGGSVGTLEQVLTNGNSVGTASGINMNSKPLSNVSNIVADSSNNIYLISNNTQKMTISASDIEVSANINMNLNKITSLTIPTASTDAVNKGYVDNNFVTLGTTQTVTGQKTINNLSSANVQGVQNVIGVNNGAINLSSSGGTGTLNLVSNGQTRATLSSSGVMTFNFAPQTSAVPSAPDDLTNKAYVDSVAGGGGSATLQDVLLNGNTVGTASGIDMNAKDISGVAGIRAKSTYDMVLESSTSGNVIIKGTDAFNTFVVKDDHTVEVNGPTTFYYNVPSCSIAPTTTSNLTNKAYVDNGLSGKQNTGTAVLLSGNQTIDGTKVFNSIPVCAGIPSGDSELANKAYVDSVAGGGGGLTYEVISGTTPISSNASTTLINGTSGFGRHDLSGASGTPGFQKTIVSDSDDSAWINQTFWGTFSGSFTFTSIVEILGTIYDDFTGKYLIYGTFVLATYNGVSVTATNIMLFTPPAEGATVGTIEPLSSTTITSSIYDVKMIPDHLGIYASTSTIISPTQDGSVTLNIGAGANLVVGGVISVEQFNTPLVRFDGNIQSYDINTGVLVINKLINITGPFPGTNTVYTAYAYSPVRLGSIYIIGGAFSTTSNAGFTPNFICFYKTQSQTYYRLLNRYYDITGTTTFQYKTLVGLNGFVNTIAIEPNSINENNPLGTFFVGGQFTTLNGVSSSSTGAAGLFNRLIEYSGTGFKQLRTEQNGTYSGLSSSAVINPSSGSVSLTVATANLSFQNGLALLGYNVYVQQNGQPANNFRGIITSAIVSNGDIVIGSITNINGTFGAAVAYTVSVEPTTITSSSQTITPTLNGVVYLTTIASIRFSPGTYVRVVSNSNSSTLFDASIDGYNETTGTLRLTNITNINGDFSSPAVFTISGKLNNGVIGGNVISIVYDKDTANGSLYAGGTFTDINRTGSGAVVQATNIIRMYNINNASFERQYSNLNINGGTTSQGLTSLTLASDKSVYFVGPAIALTLNGVATSFKGIGRYNPITQTTINLENGINTGYPATNRYKKIFEKNGLVFFLAPNLTAGVIPKKYINSTTAVPGTSLLALNVYLPDANIISPIINADPFGYTNYQLSLNKYSNQLIQQYPHSIMGTIPSNTVTATNNGFADITSNGVSTWSLSAGKDNELMILTGTSGTTGMTPTISGAGTPFYNTQLFKYITKINLNNLVAFSCPMKCGISITAYGVLMPHSGAMVTLIKKSSNNWALNVAGLESIPNNSRCLDTTTNLAAPYRNTAPTFPQNITVIYA